MLKAKLNTQGVKLCGLIPPQKMHCSKSTDVGSRRDVCSATSRARSMAVKTVVLHPHNMQSAAYPNRVSVLRFVKTE